MRDMAVVTVLIGCFDADRLIVDQDPKQGVETKFSKTPKLRSLPLIKS